MCTIFLRYYWLFKFSISCFLWIKILNSRLYLETSFKDFSFLKDNKRNALLIYSNQEYCCRLLRKVCSCIRPLSFIQTSKNVLIIETMRMCVHARNYWKCVNSKRLCIELYHDKSKKRKQQQLEVRNSQVTKSSYEMTSQLESEPRKFLQKVFFRVTNSTS